MDLNRRYRAIREEVDRCCQEVGRDPREVRIIAVSKTVGLDLVEEAYHAGIRDFGENRVDDLQGKQDAFPEATWHFIGNIQSRRIPDIVAHSQVIHSLYKEHHLAALEKAAAAEGKVQKALIEVNVSGEHSKGGIEPSSLQDILEAALVHPHIRICGLMTMAPQGNRQVARECFKDLRRLQLDEQARFSGSIKGLDLHELSMGMSEDWPIAIAEGATMVRIGRAIFEDRFPI